VRPLRQCHLVHPYHCVHTTLSRHQSHHVTDDAGHQQTQLLMLAISHMLRVWGAVAWHLPWILRNRWEALMARVSWSTISCTNVRLTRALFASTDRIDSNSYMNTHWPTWCSPLDKQCRLVIIMSMTVICRLKDLELMARVPPCRPPHANNTRFSSVSQRLHLTPGCHCVLWSFWCRQLDDHLHRRPPRRSAVWVVVHGSWRGFACVVRFSSGWNKFVQLLIRSRNSSSFDLYKPPQILVVIVVAYVLCRWLDTVTAWQYFSWPVLTVWWSLWHCTWKPSLFLLFTRSRRRPLVENIISATALSVQICQHLFSNPMPCMSSISAAGSIAIPWRYFPVKRTGWLLILLSIWLVHGH